MTTEEKDKYYFYKIKGVNYIGSSHCKLSTRWKSRDKHHNEDCFNPNSIHYNVPVYKYIREQTDITKIELEILHTGMYTNLEKKIKEQELIDKYDSLNNGLNTNRAHNSLEYNNEYRKIQNAKRKKTKTPCKHCGLIITGKQDSCYHKRHYKSCVVLHPEKRRKTKEELLETIRAAELKRNKCNWACPHCGKILTNKRSIKPHLKKCHST